MKRHHTTRRPNGTTTTSLADTIAERTRMNLELLQQLALTVAENERAQRRFRNAVSISVSRIETMVQVIHGAQIVELHKFLDSDKLQKHTADADEFISQGSRKMGLTLIKYIYGKRDDPMQRFDRRKKWSDWEI